MDAQADATRFDTRIECPKQFVTFRVNHFRVLRDPTAWADGSPAQTSQEDAMSFRNTLVSGLLAATVAATAFAGSARESAAFSLSPAEAAAIAGIGGLIVGTAIASHSRPRYVYRDVYHDPHRVRASAWDAHVARCYARYRSYDHVSDTYLGYDGYRHYCNL
jgi:hypothetical protein